MFIATYSTVLYYVYYNLSGMFIGTYSCLPCSILTDFIIIDTFC